MNRKLARKLKNPTGENNDQKPLHGAKVVHRVIQKGGGVYRYGDGYSSATTDKPAVVIMNALINFIGQQRIGRFA